jgi:hypothetical protein
VFSLGVLFVAVLWVVLRWDEDHRPLLMEFVYDTDWLVAELRAKGYNL